MESPNEQDLISGARAFDLPMLSAIYDRFSPGIYRYAMRLLGDDCLAEDCVADTFSRFLHALKAGQGPCNHLQAYLYRIAHNWITDRYRRCSPPTMELDESLRSDNHPHPEDQVEDLLEQDRVRLALRILTPDQRLVITLRFLEGWENEEVSVALQKPVGAVKALQHRAVQALRKNLLRAEKEGTYEG